MSYTLLETLETKTWQEFVEQHPDGNIFHTPEMFQVFESAQEYRPQLFAATDNQGQILALLLPVQHTLLGGLLRRLTTRAIVYGGVLCTSNSQDADVLTFLLHRYSKSSNNHTLFTELRNLSDTSANQKVLEQNGFIFSEHLNFLIDLSCSTDEVFQKIGARTRKHIRQGLRKGNVIIEEITDRKLLSKWYELVSTTYHNARVPLAHRSLFEAAYDILSPRGMIQFWVARIGTSYIAASAELLYKDVMYGWYSGVDRTFSAESPGELLMWHILEWGATNGFKTYDFGGAGKPDESYGVRDFKAKFGGKLICYGRNTAVHSPTFLRWSQRGYSVYRQMLKLTQIG